MSVCHAVAWAVTEAADADKLIQFIRALPKTATKNGKPYIVSSKAGHHLGPAPNKPIRSQGYNVMTLLEFASKEDILYFGGQDPVHAELLKLLDGKVGKSPLVLPFTSGGEPGFDGESGSFHTLEECGM